MTNSINAAEDFSKHVKESFRTILADPPWRFMNRTGKMAPEHKRLLRYPTLTLKEICEIPVADVAAEQSHLYLWVPNALLAEGIEVMKAWGFTYKTNLIWFKTRKDGGPDGRGVGFYFRNTTEIILFGIKGRFRTLAPGRSQVNVIRTQKREHSRKPDEVYEIIEKCSPGPYLELFARGKRPKWEQWGNQVEDYQPTWSTYANHSQVVLKTDRNEKKKPKEQQVGFNGVLGTLKTA
jgi:N6-adenosine-specific RNA methylase IME4